ncbi:hypothetical protein KSP39_PZI021693 [Platanthera zijinensis]|uniref:J domain-containing protein n=1 Tax=Platanthera zijinensis TaxID=2320716 RepID=A0AAP0AXD4_9ASPA
MCFLVRQYGYPLSGDKFIAGADYRRRALSTSDFPGGEHSGKNAYEVLGISENSSTAEIKASFRKLAKEMHPDVRISSDEAAASLRFLQILAAYELTLYGTSIAIPIGDLVQILSDSERRAHYDIYLFSKKVLKKKSGHCSVMYTYKSPVAISKPDEVVEWLEWYKHVIHDIVTRKKVATGFGYFDELESELYSAIHFAYHGPVIDSMNMLPNSFEAEERSLPETSEVLHLVSGRSLFGIICTIDKVPELSHPYSEKLSPFETSEDGAFDYCCKEMMPVNTRLPGEECFEELKVGTNRNHTDVYSNMELHISGKLVATATRSPNCKLKDSPIPDNEDHINVFLNLNGNTYTNLADPQNSNAIGSKILLGTITGLGNNAEGICSVYDRYGQKTHVIIKHRTFLVTCMWDRVWLPHRIPGLGVDPGGPLWRNILAGLWLGLIPHRLQLSPLRVHVPRHPSSQYLGFEMNCWVGEFFHGIRAGCPAAGVC